MTRNKRKNNGRVVGKDGVVDVVKCEVVFENFMEDGFTKNPLCPHGPKIGYDKVGKDKTERFYSCSAFRSASECRLNCERVVNKKSNSGLAQYLFSEETSNFFADLIRDFKYKNALCLGVSTVHGKLMEGGINSLLLDIDLDLVKKFSDSAAHYNMCNHYFFDSDFPYKEFLRKSGGKLILVMDPPFSAKPELLSAVHKLIRRDLAEVTKASKVELKIIWVAPYFLEGHIRKSNSDLLMSDYMVNYADHVSFSSGEKSRKNGSPVRFFTDLPLESIKLEENEYRECKECKKYVMKTNNHCDICGACTSKDGQTYKHCFKCEKCVKPTWSHCSSCQRCDHPERHSCSGDEKRARRP